MTEKFPIDSVNSENDLLTNPADQRLLRAKKSLNHIVELFRLTTCHEIRSALIQSLLDIYPNSLIAAYELSSSTKFSIVLCNSPKELQNPETIDPHQFRLRHDVNSMYLANYADKPKLISVFTGSASVAVVGQFTNENLTSFLVLENPKEGYFSQSDLEILPHIFDAFSLAQKRANLFEILEQKVERQSQLLNSVSEIFQQTSKSNVYQSFLNSVCKYLKIDHAQLEITPLTPIAVDSEKEKSN